MEENEQNKLSEKTAQSDEDIIDLTRRVQAKPSEAVLLSPEQIETAVEKALKKMLTAKIEAMVIEAIERAVKKEIEKINTLIEELEDNQK
jgi:hypothetical protein